MAAQVVYHSAIGDPSLQGSLFDGVAFWLSATVPSKSTIRQYIQSNGGRVVHHEKDADIKLVDHLRKNFPDNSYSYKYVDLSVRYGALENLEDHRVAPRGPTVRPAGSITKPVRSIRTPFTEEDDRVLKEWVATAHQRLGGTAGNVIYKELEQHNPRHTWQSWRDRWVKRYRNIDYDIPLPPSTAVSVPANAPPTPPTENTERDVKLTQVAIGEQEARDILAEKEAPQQHRSVAREITPGQAPARETESASEVQQSVEDQEGVTIEYQDGMSFNEEDEDALLSVAKTINAIDPESLELAFEAFAKTVARHHTAQEWVMYWNEVVKPLYFEQKRQRREAGYASSEADEGDDNEEEDEPEESEESRAKQTEMTPEQQRGNQVLGNGKAQTDGSADYVPEGSHTSASDEVLDSRVKLDKSPSYHSDSPVVEVTPKQASKRPRVVELLDDMSDAADDEAPATDLPPSLPQQRIHSPKRKHEDSEYGENSEDTVPHSTPPRSLVERGFKRARTELPAVQEARVEIPATPQKKLRHMAKQLREAGVEPEVDSEEEEEDGQSDEEGEQEEEEDPTPLHRGPSPTLTDPDYHYQDRIDAQIFTEITSSIKSKSSEAKPDGNDDKGSVGEDSGDDEGSNPEILPRSIRDESMSNIEEEEENDQDSGVDEPRDERDNYQLFLSRSPEVAETQFSTQKAPNIHVDGSLSISRLPKKDATPPKISQLPQPTPRLATPIEILAHDERYSRIDDLSNTLPEPESLTEEEVGARLVAWTDYHTDKGVPFEIIEAALRASSMDLSLATIALKSIQAGRSLPTNVPGIWTAGDDMDRISTSHKARYRVMKKHGREQLAGRGTFLENYDE